MGKKSLVWIMALGLIPMIFLGCASIIGKGGPETLNIRSAPDQADVLVFDETGSNIFSGKTPTNVSLEKKRSYFGGKKYTVKIIKPGFAEHTVMVDTNMNGWYIGGNLIFGGLIGWLIVDPMTGAMWSLDTKDVNVTMKPSEKSSQKEPFNVNVVLLQDVPTCLRTEMVKVSQ